MPAPLISTFPLALHLHPLNRMFTDKRIPLPHGAPVKLGRHIDTRTSSTKGNGYFDATVLSRQHAEIWCEDGKLYIKDTKSSNGTFLNGRRLSAEGIESDRFELKDHDILEFGRDILAENRCTVIHPKVVARVELHTGIERKE